MKTEDKLHKLKKILSETRSVVIALSGGTDSVFLAYTASKTADLNLLAVTVNSPYMFASELKEAKDFCRENGIPHKELAMAIPEDVRRNPQDRCYQCKREVIKLIKEEAARNGMAIVFDGTNADDIYDYRPGMQALKEAGVRSPLLEAGLTKADIKMFSKEAGLITWNKPSNSCLMTRFPHGTHITEEDLRKAESAEIFLNSKGFGGSRIRVHNNIARIECKKEQIPLLLDEVLRDSIVENIKKLGYEYVALDLEGYRSGSMNLNKK